MFDDLLHAACPFCQREHVITFDGPTLSNAAKTGQPAKVRVACACGRTLEAVMTPRARGA